MKTLTDLYIQHKSAVVVSDTYSPYDDMWQKRMSMAEVDGAPLDMWDVFWCQLNLCHMLQSTVQCLPFLEHKQLADTKWKVHRRIYIIFDLIVTA